MPRLQDVFVNFLFLTIGFGSAGFGAQPTNGGLFGGSTSAPAATGGLFGGGTSTFGSTPATNTGFSRFLTSFFISSISSVTEHLIKRSFYTEFYCNHCDI